MKISTKELICGGLFLLELFCMSSLQANSRLLATGGVTQVEGSAGSGIVPWAVISGYSSTQELSGVAAYTRVETDDYRLYMRGVSLSYNNRIELSFAKQKFELDTLGDLIGLPGADLEQDIIGLKLRLLGDVIYTSLPQISLGLQYKRNQDFELPDAVGAKNCHGVDVYLSATKLWLAGFFDRNVLLNGTIRATRANELGLLGFGGDEGNSYDYLFEGSAVLFLNRYSLIGMDYRQKPNNLAFAKESNWKDYFIAVAPNKHLSFVAAYADLGSIATLDNQTGWYFSMELSF